MNYFLKMITCLLLLLTLTGYCPIVENAYFIPQLIGIYILIMFVGILLYKTTPYRKLFLTLILMGIFFLAKNFEFHGHLKLFLLMSAIPIYYLGSFLKEDQKFYVKRAIFGIGFLQAILIISQTVIPHIFELPFKNGIPIGTVGNSDFLATIISVAIFYLLYEKMVNNKSLKIVIICLLSIGLLLTRSKGTILITLFLATFNRKYKWVYVSFLIISFFSLKLFINELNGRLHLWYVSLYAGIDSYLTGHGFFQFGNCYFSKVSMLMADEIFRERFGSWTSEVSDAHNIFLHYWVEIGIIGLILVIGFLAFSLMRIRFTTRGIQLSVILIIIKSMYTVVLGSTQGLFLWLLMLGMTTTSHLTEKIKNRIIILITIMASLCLPALLSLMISSHHLFEGMTYLKVFAFKQASESIEEGLALNNESTDLLLAKAFLFSQTNQCKKVAIIVDKVITLKKSMDTYKRGGHILFNCGFYGEARKIFLTLHQIFPEHRTTMMKLAWIAYNERKFLLSKYWAKKVLNVQPRRKSYSDEKNLKDAQFIMNQSTI